MDLFGDPAPAAKPAARPLEAPRFGTPEWDRCPCGRWATLHFPNLGGLRRCMRCAIAQGRWTPPTQGERP